MSVLEKKINTGITHVSILVIVDRNSEQYILPIFFVKINFCMGFE